MALREKHEGYPNGSSAEKNFRINGCALLADQQTLTVEGQQRNISTRVLSLITPSAHAYVDFLEPVRKLGRSVYGHFPSLKRYYLYCEIPCDSSDILNSLGVMWTFAKAEKSWRNFVGISR